MSDQSNGNGQEDSGKEFQEMKVSIKLGFLSILTLIFVLS